MLQSINDNDFSFLAFSHYSSDKLYGMHVDLETNKNLKESRDRVFGVINSVIRHVATSDNIMVLHSVNLFLETNHVKHYVQNNSKYVELKRIRQKIELIKTVENTATHQEMLNYFNARKLSVKNLPQKCNFCLISLSDFIQFFNSRR